MNKKNNLWSLLTIVVAAMLSVGFASCGDDDDNDSGKRDDGKQQTDTKSNQDPEGTVVLNMTNGSKDNWYDIGLGRQIHIDEANNFVGYYADVEFVSLGEVSGLGKITSIPSTGWSKSAAVVPGNGYIARCGNRYARIFVVDYTVATSGGIMGATIKYQSPFQLPINLETSSLTFASEASSLSVKLKNPTSVTVEQQPDWCTVSSDINTITVSVTENLSAQQYSGEIVLKNSVGTAKLTVTQKGATSPKFEGGRGTAEDPYKIKTAQQLENVKMALDAHFALTSDINLGSYLNVNGSGWDPLGKSNAPFTGTFDGQGHAINGLWIKRPTTDNVGLFGYIKDATIKGVRIKLGTNGITGHNYVGGLAGFGAVLTSIPTISQCSVSGAIVASGDVAGIIGKGDDCNVSECYTEGSAISSNNVVSGIGGNAIDCYSLMDLQGGYVYSISRTHTKCYYAGKASPTDYFYSSGTYSYFDNTLGTTNVYSYDNTKTNARTTSQMMSQSNYEGWDFLNTWKITEGKTYPTLRCFGK